jgi:hypothetical protein
MFIKGWFFKGFQKAVYKNCVSLRYVKNSPFQIYIIIKKKIIKIKNIHLL